MSSANFFNFSMLKVGAVFSFNHITSFSQYINIIK